MALYISFHVAFGFHHLSNIYESFDFQKAHAIISGMSGTGRGGRRRKQLRDNQT